MPRRRSFPKRGSVYRVQFDPAYGREIRKSRPAVVVSNNHLNELAATVLVVPITTGRFPYYHWIPLEPPEGGVTRPSVIVTEQVRALDKRRLKQRIGAVSDTTLRRLEHALRDHLGLPESDVLA